MEASAVKTLKSQRSPRAHEGRRENLHSTASFIILTCDPYYGRFRTTMKTERRGPKTSMQRRLVSENVQLFDCTFDNFAQAVGRYGSACSSLRGMPKMLHSLFGRVQSVQERFVFTSDGARLVY